MLGSVYPPLLKSSSTSPSPSPSPPDGGEGSKRIPMLQLGNVADLHSVAVVGAVDAIIVKDRKSNRLHRICSLRPEGLSSPDGSPV